MKLMYTENALSLKNNPFWGSLYDIEPVIKKIPDAIGWVFSFAVQWWWVLIVITPALIILEIVYTWLEGKYISGRIGTYGRGRKLYHVRSPRPDAPRWRWRVYRIIRWLQWYL